MSDPGGIREAVAAVRREGRKAAALYALVDAALLALLASLAVTVLGPLGIPATIGPVDVGLASALVVGVATFAVEFTVRQRRYGVERFEAENPALGTALRTARDAAAREATDPMARRLYATVTDRLSTASSEGFVDERRLAVSIVLLVVVSVAVVQTALVGFDVRDLGIATDPEPAAVDAGPEVTGNGTLGDDDDGLRAGREILGAERNVSAGSDPLLANVTRSSGGEGNETRNYEPDPAGEDPAIGARRAGYDPDEDLENADLVREYTLRLEARETDD